MLHTFWKTLRIYLKLQLLQVRTHMEYRVDFFVGFIGAFISHTTGFIFIYAIFTTIPEIQGWTLWEMGFLYGLMVIPHGLMEMLFDGVWRLRLLVNTSEFDRVLLRPISPIVQVFTQIFTVHSFGTTGLGFLILIYASIKIGLVWTVWKLAYLILTLIASTSIILSVNLITNSFSFWVPASTSTMPFMVANTTELAKFPIGVYAPIFQFIFSWILPFAFISYYPGVLLLGRPETSWISYISIVPALVLMLIARIVWHMGINRYESAGH